MGKSYLTSQAVNAKPHPGAHSAGEGVNSWEKIRVWLWHKSQGKGSAGLPEEWVPPLLGRG